MYDSLGVADDARAEVERYSALAMDAVKGIGLSPVRTEVLRRFADSLVGRAK